MKLIVTVLAVCAWLVAVPGPAVAAEPCVGVLVDASRAGGSVRTACARLDARNGFEVLRKARFSYRLRPDGLICQINGFPKTCSATTQRYWSYWTRAAGSARWTYNLRGPGAHDPKPGSTEGWVFQNGGRARPSAVRQSRICPVLVRPSSSAIRTVAKSAVATTAAASPRPSTASPTPRRTTRVAAAQSARASLSPSTDETAGVPEGDPASDEPVATVDGADRKPPLGLVIGAAMLTTLAVATVVRARRPRPPSAP